MRNSGRIGYRSSDAVSCSRLTNARALRLRLSHFDLGPFADSFAGPSSTTSPFGPSAPMGPCSPSPLGPCPLSPLAPCPSSPLGPTLSLPDGGVDKMSQLLRGVAGGRNDGDDDHPYGYGVKNPATWRRLTQRFNTGMCVILGEGKTTET